MISTLATIVRITSTPAHRYGMPLPGPTAAIHVLSRRYAIAATAIIR